MIKQINAIKKLRQKIFSSDNLQIIQIGASDGETNDIACHITKETDHIIYIEPCKNSFELLLHNKRRYKNAIFLNLALVPEVLSDAKISTLSDDPLNQGASFIENLPSSFRKSDTLDTKKITIASLLNLYNIKKVDILFCDAEGLDNILVQELLKFIQPRILFFESFFWFVEDFNAETSKGTLIIPSRNSIKVLLENNGYKHIDFAEEPDTDKAEDILAWYE